MKHIVNLRVSKQNGEYVFTPHSNLWHPDNQLAAGGKFVFNKNNHQGMKKEECHYIEFRLHPQHNEGLRFPSKKEDAMWVIKPTPGHSCPDATDVPGKINYTVMGPQSRDSDMQLTAYNRNMDEEQWSFSLNFLKDAADDGQISKYVCWDPIGENQDGGIAFRSSNLLSYGAVAVGSGVVGALATTAALVSLNLTC